MTFPFLFYRKRPGEVAKAKLCDYQKAKEKQWGKDPEVLASLPPYEQVLAEKYLLMKIEGKRGRHVHVLISKIVEESLELLFENRSLLDPKGQNEYLFPVPGKTKFLDPWVLYRKFAEKCDLEDPGKMRGTNLRKHLATSMHCFDMTENDLAWPCCQIFGNT